MLELSTVFYQNLPNQSMELSVKTYNFAFSAEFWRYSVLSGGTHRRDLRLHQSEEMKTSEVFLDFFEWGSNPTIALIVTHRATAPRLATVKIYQKNENI